MPDRAVVVCRTVSGELVRLYCSALQELLDQFEPLYKQGAHLLPLRLFAGKYELVREVGREAPVELYTVEHWLTDVEQDPDAVRLLIERRG